MGQFLGLPGAQESPHWPQIAPLVTDKVLASVQSYCLFFVGLFLLRQAFTLQFRLSWNSLYSQAGLEPMVILLVQPPKCW